MRKIVFALMLLVGVSGIANAQRKCARVHPEPHIVGVYTAGELAGRSLADLYAGYTGVRGLVPEKITVDPARQLDSLWKVKIRCNGRSAVVASLRNNIMREYRSKRTHKSLGEFMLIADREARSVKNDMDWDKLGKIYHLSPSQLSVVKKRTSQIGGRELVAYGLTELMPSADGELNLQVLEFLVRNYGPEFVYSIPAVHDRFASFGFFQFTSYAIYSVRGKREGASKASLALRRDPLPGSAAFVRGPLQFRAAWLFAAHNTAVLVGRLNKKERDRFENLSKQNLGGYVQFIAAAHNSPADARAAARRWLNNNARSEFYRSVSDYSVRGYAVKTKANLAALSSKKNFDGVLYGRR